METLFWRLGNHGQFPYPYDGSLWHWADRTIGQQSVSKFQLIVRLTGNTFGRQQLFLRASEDLSRCLIVELSGGRLIVTERRHGKDTPLLQENVDVLLDRPRLSVEEAQKEAEVKDYETLARYAPTRQAAERYAQKQRHERRNQPVLSRRGLLPMNRSWNEMPGKATASPFPFRMISCSSPSMGKPLIRYPS